MTTPVDKAEPELEVPVPIQGTMKGGPRVPLGTPVVTPPDDTFVKLSVSAPAKKVLRVVDELVTGVAALVGGWVVKFLPRAGAERPQKDT